MSGSKDFSKTDLKEAFQQLELDEIKTLEQLFSKIHDSNFNINKAKWIIGQNILSFFGVEISENEINADPNKTETEDMAKLRKILTSFEVFGLRTYL